MPVADVLTAVTDHIKRAPGYDLYRDYENGDHKYPYASEAYRKKFGWIVKQARLNACYTVRSNFTDLVQIQAWSGAGAKQADGLAQTIDLDMVIDLTINEAWRCGDGYVLVWPGTDGKPRPWYHRADQAGFLVEPGDPSTLRVGWKVWDDTDGYGRVNLYYRDRVERWVTIAKIRQQPADLATWDQAETLESWAPYAADGEPEVQPHDFGRVPWIHIPFDAQTQGGHGRSILRDVIAPQDGLNHTVHALLSNTEWYGKVVAGLLNHQPDVTLDPNTGKVATEKVELDETRNSIFGIKGPGPLTQLNPPNSENLLAVKRGWHVDIANAVGVPVSDVVPELGNIPSGAALRVLASRRTNTVRSFTRSVRGRIGDLMGLLGVPDAWPEFVDPAPVDDTERIENATAKRALGYPLEELLPGLGEDPDDIVRILEAVAGEEAAVGRAARTAYEQGRTGTAPASGSGASDVKARADAMGVLIRAGVDPEDAAAKVGLDVDFTGAVPTSLRLPEADAGRLEAT